MGWCWELLPMIGRLDFRYSRNGIPNQSTARVPLENPRAVVVPGHIEIAIGRHGPVFTPVFGGRGVGAGGGNVQAEVVKQRDLRGVFS